MTANYKKFWNRYVKVDNLLKVSRLFRFEKHKENVQKKTEELIQHYNEFDLD